MREGPEAVREDQSRWVSILRGLWKFRKNYSSAIVYICTGNAVLHNFSSCTWNWPKPLLFVYSLFFVLFSHSLDCISCRNEEMCDTPIGTTRWFTGQDLKWSKEVDVTGGWGGMVTEVLFLSNPNLLLFLQLSRLPLGLSSFSFSIVNEDTVTVPKILIPGREFIFRPCEVGAVWHLIPRKNKS